MKEGYNTMIHTHPSFIDVVNNRAIKDIFVGLPSIQDLDIFINGPYKNTIIAQIDEKEEIEGYVALRKKKQFDSSDYKVKEDLEKYDKTKQSEQLDELRKFCDKYKIKYRFVPMPDYEFNEKDAMFVKKKYSRLEGKVEAVAMWLLGITLLLQLLRLHKISGFAILDNLSNLSNLSNTLTIILILISLILLIYTKIKRKTK